MEPAPLWALFLDTIWMINRATLHPLPFSCRKYIVLFHCHEELEGTSIYKPQEPKTSDLISSLESHASRIQRISSDSEVFDHRGIGCRPLSSIEPPDPQSWPESINETSQNLNAHPEPMKMTVEMTIAENSYDWTQRNAITTSHDFDSTEALPVLHRTAKVNRRVRWTWSPLPGSDVTWRELTCLEPTIFVRHVTHWIRDVIHQLRFMFGLCLSFSHLESHFSCMRFHDLKESNLDMCDCYELKF